MKRDLLLSPELKKKVDAKVKECLKIAEKEYKQKFEMPEIRYNIKNTRGGMAYHADWLIRLNLILLVENEEHFLATTVPHEVAHLINRKVNKVPEGKKRLMPHGKEWKAVMDLLKVPPKVTHNYDCSSIERVGKRKGGKVKVNRVERMIRQLSKLTEEEQHDFGLAFRLMFS